MAAGTELCPHCQRPFKRLRAHLPHCKAAPPAPGSAPRSAPGPERSPGTGTGSAPRSAPGPEPSLGTGTGSAPRSAPGPEPSLGTGTGSAPRSAPGPERSPGTGTGSAPRSAPGPEPSLGTGTGSAPRSAPGPEPSLGTGTAPAQPPGPGRGSGPRSPRSRSPAVQDVARSLDLHPEEVQDVPRQLQKGVKVVIEQHRARVLREKQPRGRAGSGGEGTDPGAAAPPQRRKTAQKSKSKETRSQGAVGSGAGSSKGEKSNLKATKALQESGNSRGDLVQQEGRDKFTAGEEQVHLEFGVGSKPLLAALHPKKLHLSLMEAFGGDGQGTSKDELGSRQRLRDSGEGGEAVSEAGLNAGRAPELGLLHAAKIQPTCSAQSARTTARGLEWFPDLYPDYEGLRIFPGKHFHEDLRIGAETPKGGFTQGQQGPLSERPLMEVRLGELHSWIRTCNFSPQGLLAAVQRAWSSYCARYIQVKQGGPAGISMLLAGYCLFSYGWNYQHFKRHRWRKYH